jgi:two-component system, cell cycle sensor histidine kinase and response regulator CckA
MNQQVSLGAPSPVGGLRIVVVDDEDSVRNLAKEMLEEMGHDVTDAASGRSAIEHLKAGSACDLLLVDFAMPVMNGSEFAAEARKLRPDVPILFITGYADSEELQPWSALGVRILAKPFSYDGLAEAVHQASWSSAEVSKIVPLRGL